MNRKGRSAAASPPSVDFTGPAASTLVDAAVDDIEAGDHREGERYAGADLSGSDLGGASFLGCQFDTVTFTDTQLRGSRFIETAFSAPFAHSFRAARTTWRDVLVERPRWGSAELFDSELESVHIVGGKIDYLNLRGSRLDNVIIEDCAITDLDLGGFTGTRVALVNCRVGTLDLTGATCSGVDLRTSDFSALHGLAGFAGVVIDSGQLGEFAPLLAEHLGLRVEG